MVQTVLFDCAVGLLEVRADPYHVSILRALLTRNLEAQYAKLDSFLRIAMTLQDVRS